MTAGLFSPAESFFVFLEELLNNGRIYKNINIFGGSFVEELDIVREEDIKSLICMIPDVLSCRVIMGSNSKIEEMHVLCSTGKNIKQIVRDIQSAINAKFDIDIDYKVISVAQIDVNDFKESRLKIAGITVMNIGNSIKAVVSLENEGHFYEGSSIKVKSLSNKYKAIAEAAIAAVEEFINTKGIFYLEGIEKKKISGNEVFLSLVGCAYKNNNSVFSGCCLVKNDENESIVKSVLDALNRKIGNID